jgi:hypothetical protein
MLNDRRTQPPLYVLSSYSVYKERINTLQELSVYPLLVRFSGFRFRDGHRGEVVNITTVSRKLLYCSSFAVNNRELKKQNSGNLCLVYKNLQFHSYVIWQHSAEAIHSQMKQKYDQEWWVRISKEATVASLKVLSQLPLWESEENNWNLDEEISWPGRDSDQKFSKYNVTCGVLTVVTTGL